MSFEERRGFGPRLSYEGGTRSAEREVADMTVVDRVRDVVLPVLSTHDFELYDLDVRGPLVRVVVDRADGVDLDDLSAVTRDVSRALDDADPITHRYTLEVTSPGVERPLRTPTQFVRAVGEVVKVRLATGGEGERRVQGKLTAADEHGITVRVDVDVDVDVDADSGADDADGEAPPERTLSYDEIERARTVFEWGTPGPKPGRSAASRGSKKKRERRS
jgi:ribosome maturation factor RimP